MVHYISPAPLTFEVIDKILSKNYKLALSEDSKKLINDCKAYLDHKIESSAKPLYGITTGFGSLCKISISKEDLSQLQANLVMSHACSLGEPIHQDIIRLMLLLKAHALSLGKSGVQLVTVERIIDMFNHNVLPVVRELGSLGASGDLAPLANLFLPLINEGEVWYKGKICDAKAINAKLGWAPIELGAKEGLALLNGTQFMSSHAVYALLKAFKIAKYADIIGALSLEAYDGRIDPFLPQIQAARPHPGQIETARNIRTLLEGSEFQQKEKTHVQDPYSFRCMPQVHGASKDSIMYVASVVEREINSVTDNPTIFMEDDLIISGGNFHGQPMALAFDFLGIALSELANISERRLERLVNPNLGGFPAFLVKKGGLNSGFMIVQYSAAALVSENKVLAHPASVDSIPSSAGQEDHVSMGTIAARKAAEILGNVRRVLAMELMCACQAVDLLGGQERLGKGTAPAYRTIRAVCATLEDDRPLYEDINRCEAVLRDGSLVRAVEKAAGEIEL